MKNSPYLKVIIFALLAFAIGFLIPHTSYFKNKTIKDLEKENKQLHEEIDSRNKKIILLDSSFNKLKNDKIILEKEVDTRNIHIINLEHQIDSINGLIETSDTTIIKIKKQGYEEINTINNWDTNKRINFFSDYFKGYNK